MIREVVNEGRMPPWGLDPHVGEWKNDPSFTEDELNKLNTWIDGGMAKGDPADMPPPMEFHDDWNIGEPDVIYEMPEEVVIDPMGVVPYRYYTTDLNLTEDRYVQKMEVLPGNRKVVHHIIVFLQPPGMTGFSEDGVTNTMLEVYAPGSPAGDLPEGLGRKIPAGSKLVWQVHYTPTGKEERDQSRFGIVWAKEKPERLVRTATVVNTQFEIPPHAENYVVEADVDLPHAATIYSFTPHMHYRGTAMNFYLTYPDGNEVLACSIPKYDFNWQLDYLLKEPLQVPAGTNLRVVGVFDNSENNPYNPDPTKSVRWGEQTWEEMLMGGIFMSWDDEEAATAGSRGSTD
jgi:hypothetical protein